MVEEDLVHRQTLLLGTILHQTELDLQNPLAEMGMANPKTAQI
jgi:hypothetical protein